MEDIKILSRWNYYRNGEYVERFAILQLTELHPFKRETDSRRVNIRCEKFVRRYRKIGMKDRTTPK